jgi:hypothetical protein
VDGEEEGEDEMKEGGEFKGEAEHYENALEDKERLEFIRQYYALPLIEQIIRIMCLIIYQYFEEIQLQVQKALMLVSFMMHLSLE